MDQNRDISSQPHQPSDDGLVTGQEALEYAARRFGEQARQAPRTMASAALPTRQSPAEKRGTRQWLVTTAITLVVGSATIVGVVLANSDEPAPAPSPAPASQLAP